MKFYEFPLEEEIENDAEMSDQPLDFYLSEREYNAELIQEAVREARRKDKMLGICIDGGTVLGARQVMNKVATLEQIMEHIGSQEVKETYWGYCEQDDLSPQAKIQAGRPGQWNTIRDSIDRYLRFQPTLHNLVAAGNTLGLDECCLDEAQQKLLEDFNICLEAFKPLVDIFSRQEIPFLHEVLAELFILRMLLDDIRNDRLGTHLTALARVAAEAALSAYNLIDKDDTLPEIYIMVIVMRPTHKLQWFENHGMNTSRIQALVNEYFDQNYPLKKRESDEEGLLDLKQALQTDNMRVYLGSPVLSEETIKKQGGLLKYWDKELETCPRVARMALDHLTIPASSVDPARTFSGGPITTNGLEKYVNHSAFRAMMSIRSWWGTPVLRDIDAVANILGDVSEA
ncbi:unnamed protein product [Rhizoctonia solani]|uniref:HAT C-terminal dimerisation domain-containing protein n=1 Tax=Rhizoctonia solani TaxID=456999 RepID=A0A8H3H628_9AGAM|nr:unnamed protein product [Rhizoctonia solani]